MNTRIQPTCGVAANSLDGAVWRRSSFSGTHGNCVEITASLLGVVAVRDSKDPDGVALIMSAAGWQGFVTDIRAGRFEL
jgi:hypothetical protein